MVDAHFLITSECMAVTSAMRKSSRWANAGIASILGAPPDAVSLPRTLHPAPSSPSTPTDKEDISAKSSPETQLIAAFSVLRAVICNQDLSTFSAAAITRPFLEIVKSPLVSGYVTSLALTSLEKFLTLGVLTPESVDAETCANDLAYALTHCRFEATDRVEDDAVLLQLMSFLEKLVLSPLGQVMRGKAAQEIVETCLQMTKQMKRRDALRCSVVNVLTSSCRAFFTARDASEEMQESRARLFTTLVDTLDPNKHNLNTGIRSTVMALVEQIFEVTNGSLAEFAPRETLNDLWKYLAQLIRVTHSPKLVHESLLLVGTIMSTSAGDSGQFKHQFEFVLIYLLTSLTPLSDLPRDDSTDDMFYAGVPNRAKCVKSAPIEPGSSVLSIPTAALQKSPEIREVMVEAIVSLSVACPTLFSDLFVTYDCDLGSPDLCEDLLAFFCRQAYPDSANWSTSSVPPLCLEAVLFALNSWADLMKREAGMKQSKFHQRLQEKEGKAVETRVAETFNESPSKGIEAMYTAGLVKRNDPEDLAQFFHRCRRINKAVLGKFFSRTESKEVLEHYVKAFDFKGKRIDEALRVLLCSFRLPGESAQIENLLQQFADHYIAAGDKVEKTSDSAFILAYAVLMLNTDHFSPTVRRRMDFDAFKRNVQGVNSDITDDYVRAIFDGITTNEIIMPEEHDTDETFDYAWRENVLTNVDVSSTFDSNVTDPEVVAAIFASNWRPIVSTLSFVFATATDDLVFRRVIAGFHELAFLASKFNNTAALDHVIASLSQISVLASGDLAFPNSNIEIRIEGQGVMVSDLSTQFGDDLKAQMASITLFRILRGSYSEISRKAFSLVCKAFTNLHLYGLGTPKGIEPLPPRHTFERSKTGKPVGIFSALSSYLTSSADTPPEPSDESVDAALGATDCIKVCDIDATLAAIIQNELSFVAGALDVIPTSENAKYAPAKRFLLQLAERAAHTGELRAQISEIATKAGLTAIALAMEPDATRAGRILDSLESVSDEVLEAVLKMPPSPSVWRTLSLVSPPEPIFAYVVSHAAEVTELKPVLQALEKSDDGIEAINAVVAETGRSAPVDDYVYALGVLARFCARPQLATRELALGEVQRELLRDDQRLSWAQAATEVLIPNVLELLLKPEVWKRDPKGMDLTRQQAASMIGKVFLHLTVSLQASESSEDTEAWVATLNCLDRLLGSRRQPMLHEGVSEMLKNVILVTRLAKRGSPDFWHRFEHELKGFLPDVAELAGAATEGEKEVKSDGGENGDAKTENGESKSEIASEESGSKSEESGSKSEEPNEDPDSSAKSESATSVEGP